MVQLAYGCGQLCWDNDGHSNDAMDTVVERWFPFDSRSNCFLNRGPFGVMHIQLDSECSKGSVVGNEQGREEEEGRDEEEEGMGYDEGIRVEDKDEEEDKGVPADEQDNKEDSIYFDPNQGNHSSDIRGEEDGVRRATDER